MCTIEATFITALALQSEITTIALALYSAATLTANTFIEN